MSNREPDPDELTCSAAPDGGPVVRLLEGREVPITRTSLVTRTLPQRELRMVGAWCFVDTYGPQAQFTDPAMLVPPHPHIGLQTLSWVLDGVIEHRDSLGTLQRVAPGQVNLMTAGRGIAHSEVTPPLEPGRAGSGMHGAQLWIALPDAARDTAPRFEHVADPPSALFGEITATVLAGALGGQVSPARVHSPIVGADLAVDGPGVLVLQPAFEHALVVLTGTVEVEGRTLTHGPLLYLGSGRDELRLSSPDGARALLLGGEPFGEQILMWWNFVARSHEEIARARDTWQREIGPDRRGGGERFGVVTGFDGAALPAPELPAVHLRPR
jgi:redox-sensitive bicupin YhaK (pirin superfamily)